MQLLSQQKDSIYFPSLKEIIHPNPLTVTPETLLLDAIEQLSQATGSSCYLEGLDSFSNVSETSSIIVTDAGKPVGIVTERDVVRLMATGKSLVGMTIREVMSQPIWTLKENEFQDVFTILSFFKKYQIRHLPIVDSQGNLQGEVTPFTLRFVLQSGHFLRRRMVTEEMNTSVVTASRQENVLCLAQQMAEYKVGSIIITESLSPHSDEVTDTIAVGIVTERDILQMQTLGLNVKRLKAGEVMSQPLFSVCPTDSLWKAYSEMQQCNIRHLGVTGERGELLGIITQTNLLHTLNPVAMYETLDTLQKTVSQLEQEKLHWLQTRNTELEKTVQKRTLELQQQVERERLLSAILERIRASLDLEEILNATVTQVQQFLQTDRVLIYQFREDWSGVVVAESVAEDCPPLIGQVIHDSCFAPTWVKAYKNGRIQAITDIYHAPLTPCHQELLEHLNIRANLIVPIVHNGQLWGLLCAHYCWEDYEWKSSDIEFLKKLATQVAIALQQSELYQQSQRELQERRNAEKALQKLNKTLEEKVKTRTQELENTIQQLQEEIIHRQQVEKELQDSNYRINDVLESITEGFFALDQNWNFTHFNSLLEPILNRPVTELIGKNIWKEFPEVIGTDFEKAYRQAAKEQKTVAFEQFYPPLNTWFEVRVYPSQEGVSVYFRDISEQKRTEEALRYSEERFRIALKNSPITVFNQDLDLHYTWIYNPALGYESSQDLGTTEYDLVEDPQDAEKLIHLKQQVIETETGIRQEILIQEKGKIQCYDLTIDPLKNLEGEVVGVTCAALDLTERRKFEAQLLEVSRFQKAILESANYAIISTNPQGIIQTFNGAAQKMLGYSSDEVVGWVTPVVFHTAKEINEWAEILTQELNQDIPADFEVIIAQPKQGKINEKEWTWVRNNGVRFPALVSVTPLRDEANTIVGFLIIGSDISERKEAEAALQESQRFIQQIADSNPNIIYIFDLEEQRNIYVNREIANTLGYSPEEIQAMGASFIQSIMHPEDFVKLPAWQQRLNSAKDGDIVEFEYRMQHRDGRWRWFHSWDVIFARTSEGTPKQILGSASDITDRKLTEEAIQQQLLRERLVMAISQRIRQSLDLETILRTTVEEVQQLLLADRVLVYQIHGDGTGKTIAEGIAKDFPRVLNTIFPAEAFPQECYEAYLQGQVYVLRDRNSENILPCMVEFMQKYVIRAKLVVPIVQKDVLWGLLIAHQCSHPRHWQEWEIELLKQLATQLAIAIQQSNLYNQVQRELRDRQYAEEQIRKNNEVLATTNTELARATRLKDEFLANMSHELRTPLNAILGLSEGLQEEVFGTLTKRQHRSLATIERSGKHLLELINDILDLAKVEAGKLELHLSPVKVSGLCESSLTFVKQLAHKKNITLTSEIPPGLNKIVMDERRMRQVLINLLSNAVKFTPEGGKVTVKVGEGCREQGAGCRVQGVGCREQGAGCRVQGVEKFATFSANLQETQMLSSETSGEKESLKQMIQFSVIDTGIGIAEEDIDKLFQSFVQIDSSLSRCHEGTGLGLALVRRIVELHGGNVTVKSEVGQGSCFTVSLPIPQTSKGTFPESSPSTSSQPILQTKLPPTPNEDAPLVLLVEDNEDNITTLVSYLSAKGYHVLIANSGQKAVQMASQHQPQVILMDIHLPEMDGLTATRQIRANESTAEIPIIAVTALAMPGDREKCLAAGASDYLTKPIRLQQLASIIQSLISTTAS